MYVTAENDYKYEMSLFPKFVFPYKLYYRPKMEKTDTAIRG